MQVPGAICYSLLLDDGLAGALVEAAQALDAELLVDDVLAIAFVDGALWADFCAGAAFDAFVRDDHHGSQTSSSDD